MSSDEHKEEIKPVTIVRDTTVEGLVAETAELTPQEEALRREIIPKRHVNPNTGEEMTMENHD